MKHYNLWHSLIFQWSHWFPRVRPWQGRLQNSQNVIPILPRWDFFYFLTALIGHLAGCTCCKMDFPLNQQKQPSEIQHHAPALQIIFKASIQNLVCAQDKICVLPEGGKKRTDIMHAVSYWSCPTFSSEQMQCPHFLYSRAPLCHTPTPWCKCCSHHNNTCVCTIHRSHYSTSQRQTISHTGLHTSCMKTY